MLIVILLHFHSFSVVLNFCWSLYRALSLHAVAFLVGCRVKCQSTNNGVFVMWWFASANNSKNVEEKSY